MHPKVAEALKAKAWLTIRTTMRAEILERNDPEELRVLGLAELCTSSPHAAMRLFRQCRPHLTGRSLAAVLVDGAAAFAQFGEFQPALEWLEAYFQQEIRVYDGVAYECQAYCRWKLRAPYDEVEALYLKAETAFGDRLDRAARVKLARAKVALEQGLQAKAATLVAEVEDREDAAVWVCYMKGHLAAAAGQCEQAIEYAREGIRLLAINLDLLGTNMYTLVRLFLLRASVTPPDERQLWLDAARAVTVVNMLSMPLAFEIDAMEKELALWQLKQRKVTRRKRGLK